MRQVADDDAMRRALSGSIVALVVLVSACTSSSSSTVGAPSGTSSFPSELTPSPTATALPDLPPDEARLGGKYEVKVYVTSSNFASKPDLIQVFHFKPKCDSGACDVTLSGRIKFVGKGATDRRSAGATGDFVVKLAHLGKGYAGRVTDFFASCLDEPDKDTWEFKLSVDKAKYVGDVWAVQKWSGSWTRSVRSAGLCGTSHLRAVIRGTLQTV